MKTKVAIGIDIGGTETKFGIIKCVDENNFVLEDSWTMKTIRGQNNVEKMIDLIVEQVKRINKLRKDVKACGIAIAGLLDFYSGYVIYAPNIMWENLSIKSLFEKKFSLPTVIDNDANLATLGIYYAKIKTKYPYVQNMVCFTLGTGIGGGVIYKGELLYGRAFSATELGHIVVETEGNACGCGNRGCLESYIGARWFIHNIIRELKSRKIKTILYRLLKNNLDSMDTKILYEAAKRGDEYSLEKWRMYGKYLGVVVSNLVNIFAPEFVVLTGGVANAHKFFLPTTIQEVKNRVWPVIKESKHPFLRDIKYKVVKGQHYGVIGAGILAIKSFLL